MTDTERIARLATEIEAKYDFVRFTFADIYGICKGRTIPAKHVRNALNGTSIVSLAHGFGPRAQIVSFDEVTAINYGNVDLVPDLDTLHSLPWLGEDKYRIGQLFCNTRWEQSGELQEANTRNMALKQLQNLKDLGFSLYSGYELEFRVTDENDVPLVQGIDFASYASYGGQQDAHFDMCTKLAQAGVELDTMFKEYGSSQFEFTYAPTEGVTPADYVFKTKDGLRDMYRQRSMNTDFLSKSFPAETGNGIHFNHSLWDVGRTRNVMYDPSAEDNLSETARYWIAGLVKHTEALTALCSPTINCYRRLHTPWAPDRAYWHLNDRFSTFRVKNTSPSSTYVENRLSSGNSNPYIVMAATIAAGLDGIKNQLPCPPKNKKDAPHVPFTLTEALEALEADTAMVEALGPQFVAWFARLKREVELTELKDFDKNNAADAEAIAKERELYKYL